MSLESKSTISTLNILLRSVLIVVQKTRSIAETTSVTVAIKLIEIGLEL